MGLFNSIYAKCPNCGGSIEFQSKAGNCISTYPIDSVPLEIAEDINGEWGTCEVCGYNAKAYIPSVTLGNIFMAIE